MKVQIKKQRVVNESIPELRTRINFYEKKMDMLPDNSVEYKHAKMIWADAVSKYSLVKRNEHEFIKNRPDSIVPKYSKIRKKFGIEWAAKDGSKTNSLFRYEANSTKAS